MKRCNFCGTVKSTAEFHRCSSAQDGLQGCCKLCSKIHRRAQNDRNKKSKIPVNIEEKKIRKKNSDKNWRLQNPGKARARSRRYDKRIREATPPWLTEAQKSKIDDIYKYCPSGYHVDHIIPLKGENVCGLHVPWNLQYLLAKENIKKGNKVLT